MADVDSLTATMIDGCERQIIDADVRAAFRAVARNQFAPEQFRAGESFGDFYDRTKDPESWHKATYSDMPLVTQFDDGSNSGAMQPSSSLSAPSIVFRMLYDAAINAGDKVFEAGTGSGWTAALMSHWVGAENITTMEFDPTVAATAVENLAKAGYEPVVIVGDATKGYPDHAPYDRMIWTCALKRIPFAMVEQTRVGGLIVVPWQSPSGPQSIARLRVIEQGVAMGHFTSRCSFMLNRVQRENELEADLYIPDDPKVEGRVGVSHISCAGLMDYADKWMVSFHVGNISYKNVKPSAGGDGLWLLCGESWSYTYTPEGATEGETWQGGPRDLWTELEAAYAWDESFGRPGISRFGMTVTKDTETVWLDHPGNVLLTQT